MLKTIKVKFTKGNLEPMEQLDIKEGSELFITLDIEDSSSDDDQFDRFKSAIGAWKGTHDPEELLRNIYSDRLTGSRVEPKM